MSGCTQFTLQPPLYLGEIPMVSIVGREGFVKGKLERVLGKKE